MCVVLYIISVDLYVWTVLTYFVYDLQYIFYPLWIPESVRFIAFWLLSNSDFHQISELRLCNIIFFAKQ